MCFEEIKDKYNTNLNNINELLEYSLKNSNQKIKDIIIYYLNYKNEK